MQMGGPNPIMRDLRRPAHGPIRLKSGLHATLMDQSSYLRGYSLVWPVRELVMEKLPSGEAATLM
jgi:hypothetical protein